MVISWWEKRLRGEAELLSSLPYFRPSYMSLSSPHPVWKLAETPYEVSKACTVATMLSGRYVTDHRSRHWSSKNPQGVCQLCLVSKFPPTPGTLEHLLLECPVLSETRRGLYTHRCNYIADKPALIPIIDYHTQSQGQEGVNLHMQLLLDPSTCPMVVKAAQCEGNGILVHLLYLSRTWCHSHHQKRRKLLKLYNII